MGTYALPWSDLAAIVQWAPMDSPIVRVLHPEVAQWSTVAQTNMILADGVDVSQWGNYQRAGGRGSKPKPYPRPGDKSRSAQRFGKRRMTRAEAADWLAKRRRGERA